MDYVLICTYIRQTTGLHTCFALSLSLFNSDCHQGKRPGHDRYRLGLVASFNELGVMPRKLIIIRLSCSRSWTSFFLWTRFSARWAPLYTSAVASFFFSSRWAMAKCKGKRRRWLCALGRENECWLLVLRWESACFPIDSTRS